MFSGGFSEIFKRSADASVLLSGEGYIKGEVFFTAWAQGFVMRIEAVNMPAAQGNMFLPVIEFGAGTAPLFLPALTSHNGYILSVCYCGTASPEDLRGGRLCLYRARFTCSGVERGRLVCLGEIK